jgi:hypothetical protein
MSMPLTEPHTMAHLVYVQDPIKVVGGVFSSTSLRYVEAMSCGIPLTSEHQEVVYLNVHVQTYLLNVT